MLPNWMDAAADARENPAMRRSHPNVYATADQPRWIVLYGPQHEVLDGQRLAPGADLRTAMAAAIARLEGDGWQAEGSAPCGFVFVRRGQERYLLSLTPRDPRDTTVQSFDPFREPTKPSKTRR